MRAFNSSGSKPVGMAKCVDCVGHMDLATFASNALLKLARYIGFTSDNKLRNRQTLPHGLYK
jgi:hypothetical protein